MKTRIPFLVLLLGVAAALFAQNTAAPDPFQKADKLFKQQNWLEARAAYDEVRATEVDWRTPKVRRAVEGAVACSVKLQLWDDGLGRATEFVEKTKGAFEEAVGQRFLAGLYLGFPHQGIKQGGKFLRGQSGQGVYVFSWKKDRKDALLHYERARDLLQWLIAHPEDDPGRDLPNRAKLLNAEWIGVNFDLAAALAQHDSGRWSYGPWTICGWWWPSWGEAEEESEAVEEADYEEPRYGRGWYGGDEQEPPTGIPVGADGQPRFIDTPKAYSAGLGDGPKIRFLLDEIQRLDNSEKKDDAAKALLRWAMIARSLYGPETAQDINRQVRYNRFGRPIPQPKEPEEPRPKIWELADDQALTIAGGSVRVVTLPASESPITLLRQVEEKYPESSSRVEAHYARALYLQTRQQFPEAVAEYQKLIETDPKHARANAAKQQIKTIGLPGIAFGPTGVQLPGAETKLSFSYRNAEKVEFKATAIDLTRYVQEKMVQTGDNYWEYRNLQNSLFQNQKQDWKKYLGETTARWSQDVPREPGNRAAESSTIAPLTEPGAFVVEATTPGAEQPTRVLVLITDIAIVQKDAVKKGLILVADARGIL